MKQSRRPNGPLLTLQLKFHVAAFVVVVAQKLETYDSFSVTEVEIPCKCPCWRHCDCIFPGACSICYLRFGLSPLMLSKMFVIRGPEAPQEGEGGTAIYELYRYVPL